VLGNAVSAVAPVVPAAARALGIARTLPEADGVALTFDDGPHPQGTPAVLEALAAAGAHAAFFLVGEQVHRRPELAREIVAAGHVVALHGFHHRLQLRMTRAGAEQDIARGIATIEEAIGMRPSWHRPPYGVYSARGLTAARAAGLKPLLWSRWGKDWRKFTTPERIAHSATRALAKGDVILLHDADFYSSAGSHERTVKALPAIIGKLRGQGLDTVLPV
jgi:peptidoglycan/xylan/chitin deacetylase (PgdA/CDA1 family)